MTDYTATMPVSLNEPKIKPTVIYHEHIISNLHTRTSVTSKEIMQDINYLLYPTLNEPQL
jgi:hypothetical protein